MLPLPKNKKYSQDNQAKADHVIPAKFLFQIQDGKTGKNDKRNDFLNRFQLGGGKLSMPQTIGRNLKAILKKRDQPTDDHHQPQGTELEFQVPVPGERHKDIRNRQQQYRFHTRFILNFTSALQYRFQHNKSIGSYGWHDQAACLGVALAKPDAWPG
jgi:hypothetical protein